MDIEDILNLDTYPVDDSGTPGGPALVDRCRADLLGNLYCAIPDFVSPQALALMAEEATGLKEGAYHNHSLRNCYLHQSKDTVVSIDREPGALCIFKGCHSLHRVSPVVGDQLRIMGVFVYEFSPGIGGDPKVNATIYGPRTLAN
jgi:hypothetical protein